MGALEALDKIKFALEKFRAMQQPIIFVQHVSTQKEATFFLPDTDGIKIHKAITPLANEPVIIKHVPDSFCETKLLELLQSKNIDELVICGMMTHMCIDTTVRAAKGHGYTVVLLADASATRELSWEETSIPAKVVQQVYLASLNAGFAKVINTEAWFDEK